jgi:hypothetical protein
LCLGGGFTGIQSVVVGLGVAKAAAFAALVGDKRCCALSRSEAAASRRAFGVRRTDAGDELRSCSCCEEGEVEESEELEYGSHCWFLSSQKVKIIDQLQQVYACLRLEGR